MIIIIQLYLLGNSGGSVSPTATTETNQSGLQIQVQLNFTYNITCTLPGGHCALSIHLLLWITRPPPQAQPGLQSVVHGGLGSSQVPSQGAHIGGG